MQKTVVGIVGAGLMSHGIAQDFATAGHAVLLYDIDAGCLSKAKELIAGNLQTMGNLGDADHSVADDVVVRISIEKSLPALAKSCEYVLLRQ